MSFFGKVGLAASVAFIIAVVLMITMPRAPAEMADEAKNTVPAGATVIYQNDHATQVRVLRIENCYFIEWFSGAHWLLLRGDGGLSGVQCVP